jgi:hypothetical protein
MEPTTTSSTLDNVNQEVLAKEVLMKLKPEFDALKDSELTTVNLDVPSAVATVLGALPEIREHRPEMQKALPDLNLDRIDNLENYAIALNEAHGSYLAAIEPGSELKAVIDEATALRETFMADAQALVRRGLVDAKQLAEIKGPVGFKNLATDLNLLANVLSASLAQIAGKSAITEAELDRATRLQQRLIRLIGLREQGTPTVAEAGVLRQKAFTSLTRAYDSARRAVTFLRWDSDDVDTIAPSLYAGRGGSKRKAAPGTDAAPGATGGGTNTGVTNTGGQAGTFSSLNKPNIEGDPEHRFRGPPFQG